MFKVMVGLLAHMSRRTSNGPPFYHGLILNPEGVISETNEAESKRADLLHQSTVNPVWD